MFKLIVIAIPFLVLTGCAAEQISEQTIPKPTKIKTVCSCRSDRYNCADFKTRHKARELYECCIKKVGYDVHNLDGDSDGIACEF
ncbi:excalibur calcium-binding domain-containing protein [Candidatus Parcubacteria bacterium]|nr:excalibur calcium-binding domain-containing protein [Candidatus Parcubacteria bacterium]